MFNRIKDNILNSASPYKSNVSRSLHLVYTDLHKVGVIDDDALKVIDKKLLKRKRIMTARQRKVLLALTVVGIGIKVVELVRVYRHPTRG